MYTEMYMSMYVDCVLKDVWRHPERALCKSVFVCVLECMFVCVRTECADVCPCMPECTGVCVHA